MKNTNMNIQDAYDEWSATYDAEFNLTRDLDQSVTRHALEGLQLDAILEIGCGTGKNTGLLAQIGRRVHAVDFSRGMLKAARQAIRARNVSFAMVDLTKTWPFKDQSYDLVVCNLVLEHIEAPTRVFSEAGRALRKQGRFFVCELHPFRQYLGKKATFSGESGVIEIPAYPHHISETLEAARKSALSLRELKEWWHAEDHGEPPRLISFMFEK